MIQRLPAAPFAAPSLPSSMPVIHALLPLLSVLAVALPFLFARTQAPMANFWPLMAAGACAWLLAAIAWVGWVWGGRRAQPGLALAFGIVLAAVVGATIGLVQFFAGDVGWAPWIYPSVPGEALGNLRQRNQQATLMGLGFWALLWLVSQMQAHVTGRFSPAWTVPLQRLGRDWPLGVAGFAAPWALVVIAACAAATASRTGALEWGVVIVMLCVWRRSLGGLALALGGVGALVYGLASWGLPILLSQWTGLSMDGLFDRLGDAGQRCGTRSVLWPNVAHLIMQKPWTGWGWGELDYAHYVTVFPGERFCVLVDNAHNLPLHLAVELGLPVAAGFCALVVWWVVRNRPWAETDPLRQLAWGTLALIGVHSLLEFPLWYGPFQLVTALALCVLWAPRAQARALPPSTRARVRWAGAALGVAAVVWGAWLVHDYQRVSNLYRTAAERTAQYRADTAQQVARENRFFRNPADFAWVTTTPVTAANAAQMYPLALRQLHYSPEPRVIEAVLASARLLGLPEPVAFHTERYRIAYPADYARWSRALAAAAAPASAPLPASSQNRATSSM